MFGIPVSNQLQYKYDDDNADREDDRRGGIYKERVVETISSIRQSLFCVMRRTVHLLSIDFVLGYVWHLIWQPQLSVGKRVPILYLFIYLLSWLFCFQ